MGRVQGLIQFMGKHGGCSVAMQEKFGFGPTEGFFSLS